MTSMRRLVLGLAIALTVPAAGWGQFPTFRTAILASNPGRSPSGIAVGDFNGDGDLDVATSNSSSGTVTIFLQFDGEIFADHDESVGNVPTALLANHFDSDEFLDLVVTNGNDASLTCVRGRGDGTFDPPSPPVGVGGSPVALAAGDFDDDGDLDLAVANEGASDSSPGSVSILLGNGDCGFQNAATLETELGTVAVAVGHVNGDGNLDALVLNARSATISIFLGSSDGRTFTQRPSVATGPEPQDLALGDFNEDGALDVATADKNGDSVSVLLGNGTGSFALDRTHPVGTAPSGIAVADVNGDGNLDLAVSNNFSSDVSLLLGDGSGGFSAARTFVAEGQPIAVALGHFDSDQLLDVFTANLVGSDGSIAVLRNLGGGLLHGVEDVPADSGPSGLAVGDLDGDALPDLAVTHDSDKLITFSGMEDGGLRVAQELTLGGRLRGSAAADLNRDGRLDLAAVDNDNGVVTVLLGKRGGGFGAPRDFATGPDPAAVAPGDFNGDGIVDLAVAAFGPPGQLSVLIGLGDGRFAARCTTPVEEAPVMVAVDDFNGDGLDDAAVVNEASDSVIILRSDGDCTFTTSQTLTSAQLVRGPTAIVSGFFDTDLFLDLAVGNAIATGVQPTLLIFRGNGNATFTAGQTIRADRVDALAARDFTGDGLVDLVAVDQTSNAVRLLRGRGDGRFSNDTITPVSRMPIAVAAADLNGDGRYDAATANSQTTANNVSVLTNCVGEEGCASASQPPPVRGEANGDGRLSAADLVAVMREVADQDGDQVEDVGRAGFMASRGVDADGDGRVDVRDAAAAARRIFSQGAGS